MNASLPGFDPKLGESFQQIWQQLSGGGMGAFSLSPESLQQLQVQYTSELAGLWNTALSGQAHFQDRRFADESWSSNPMAAYNAALYLLNARTLMEMAELVQAEPKTRQRIRFAIQQWIDASAPSNFLAFNPEAQRKAVETKGDSIAKGVQNLLHDMAQGHVSQTDESQFEVGRNVATTEGAVVFENELFQLLHYKPQSAKVSERPLLLVPPCINKFYILDLQADNSFVNYALHEGQNVFLVSWRNFEESQGHVTWDELIQDVVIKAIDTVHEISGADKINALGFCVGGTLLTTALAVLAARKRTPVASLTLLTTLLDFTDTGILDIFIDEAAVELRERTIGQGGLLRGSELASTFSFLRPNDLVWNYVVGNYLKGETPPPFDLLYWNSDSTNLPGNMYCWYLRNTYLENNLVKGSAKVCGQKVDFSKIDIPVYIYGSREDHIVPITSAYLSAKALPGKKRVVVGASGHIAGVINPPAKKKRNYWVNEKVTAQAKSSYEEWFKTAKEVPGSWWPDWASWLKSHGGAQVAAPKKLGTAKFKVIEPAPGRYVKAKAS